MREKTDRVWNDRLPATAIVRFYHDQNFSRTWFSHLSEEGEKGHVENELYAYIGSRGREAQLMARISRSPSLHIPIINRRPDGRSKF